MKKLFRDYYNDKIKLEKWQLVGVISLIIVMSGVFGWIYEFILYYFDGGCKIWYMQGGNFLPWINIYAIGSIMIIFLTNRYKKKPFYVFLIAIISTGLLEFFSGYFIYKFFNGLRLWDYNVEIWNFGNIGGFVCLRSVLFFGISALLLMYGMLPFCIYLSKRMSKRIFLIMSIGLVSVVLFDEVYNLVIARIFHLVRASDFYKSIGFRYVNFNSTRN